MAAVNHQKQYSSDVCNHECRKLCVCVYVCICTLIPSFRTLMYLLHIGLPGFWTFSTL